MEISLRQPLSVDDILSRDACTDEQESSVDIKTLTELEDTTNQFGPDKIALSARWNSSTFKNPFGIVTQDVPTPFLLMQIESAFSVIPSDDRELWVQLAHAAKTLDEGEEGQGKRAWLEWSRRSSKFDPEDAERVWSSITPTNTSHEQVFRTAVHFGWDVQAENRRIQSSLGWDNTAVGENIINQRVAKAFA